MYFQRAAAIKLTYTWRDFPRCKIHHGNLTTTRVLSLNHGVTWSKGKPDKVACIRRKAISFFFIKGLCFIAVNSCGVICRVHSITIKESFKPLYRCQRIKLQAGEVLSRPWYFFFSVYCSISSARAQLCGSDYPLQLTRLELVACKVSAWCLFIPGEQIPGQRKSSYDFSPCVLHLTCHQLLSLFSELAFTISSFRYLPVGLVIPYELKMSKL